MWSVLGWEKKKVYRCALSLSDNYLLMGVIDIFRSQVDGDAINSRGVWNCGKNLGPGAVSSLLVFQELLEEKIQV